MPRQIVRRFSLLDPQTELEIVSYRISQILFCARGPSNTSLSCCWAFTTSRMSTSTTNGSAPSNENGKGQQELLYQCQVFRCDIQEAVSEQSASPVGLLLQLRVFRIRKNRS